MRTRIVTFYKHVAPCVLFGSGGWTLSQSLYDCLRSWELRSLRKVLGGKRRPGETYVDHIRRQNAYLCPRMNKWGIKGLGECMMERIFARARRCLCGEAISDGFIPACEVLKWKDELSWQFLQAVGCTNNSNQTRDRWKHPRPGRVAMWEDPFVDTFGAEWKDLLTPELCTNNNYKRRREEFVENCATRYGIRRVPKIGVAGEIPVKDIELQDGVSPLSLRWEDQFRCSFEIVGDSLLVVNWMN